MLKFIGLQTWIRNYFQAARMSTILLKRLSCSNRFSWKTFTQTIRKIRCERGGERGVWKMVWLKILSYGARADYSWVGVVYVKACQKLCYCVQDGAAMI